MSEHDHQRWEQDLAAYAIGALDSEEATAVEAHLAGCERCRADLRWLEPAVDVIPESVAQVSPPPQLRERLLAAVAADHAPQDASDRRAGWRSWLLRPATAVAAVAVIAAGAGGYALLLEDDEGGAPAVVEEVEGTGRAPNAVAVVERHGDSGTLRVTDMPPLEGGEVYQVWLRHNRTISPSSAFRPNADGAATALIPADLAQADAMMVTREPHRGRGRPSSPAVFQAQLD